MGKIIISESQIRKIIEEEMTKTDVINLIKRDKDVEKRIKELTSKVIVDLFKILWQHKSFYSTQITR